MSCSAVVSPASPTTYAVPCGRWSSRNWAVASAEVQIADSGTSIPLPSRRARRSRGVKIELLVSTRNDSPEALSASMNSWAPGIGTSSWTRTPSMSVSQVSTGRVEVMAPSWWRRPSAARKQYLEARVRVVAGDPPAEGGGDGPGLVGEDQVEHVLHGARRVGEGQVALGRRRQRPLPHGEPVGPPLGQLRGQV